MKIVKAVREHQQWSGVANQNFETFTLLNSLKLHFLNKCQLIDIACSCVKKNFCHSILDMI